MDQTISNLATRCMAIIPIQDRLGAKLKSVIPFLVPIVMGIVGRPNIMGICQFTMTAKAIPRSATGMGVRQPAIEYSRLPNNPSRSTYAVLFKMPLPPESELERLTI